MTEPTPAERRALARAIALAAARLPSASPNPTVGALVLDGTAVLGEGVSAPAGGPHAEVQALGAAAARARGVSLVVTLEPCTHLGRTPPCTDAVRAAGIARVVVGRPDPHGLAAGGAAELAAAGLEVVGPLPDDDSLARAIDAELGGFRSAVLERRPFLTLKLAQRVDGGLEPISGARWITGTRARAAVHRDRARNDAVLVGIGTVLADDPDLTARDVGAREQPRAVVLDRDARTPLEARVVRAGTLVLVAADAPEVRVAALEASGVAVRRVGRAQGGLDLGAALTTLVTEGITTVLAEPGPTLATALIEHGVVDRLVLHVAGPSTGPAVPAIALEGWRTVRRGGAGQDRVVELRPAAASARLARPHAGAA